METDVEDDLRRLELRLLQPSVRGNEETLKALLAEDFREFGSSGRVFYRQSIVAALADEVAGEPVPDEVIADFEVVQIGDGAALATYRIARPEPASQSLRSSLWVRREGGWQMLFHQGTRIP